MKLKHNIKTKFSITFTLLALIFSQSSVGYNSFGFEHKQKQHFFGIIANAFILDDIEKELPQDPPVSKTGKSLLTYNKQGFDVVDPVTAEKSFLIQAILNFSKNASHPILEVGGGYGRLSKMILEQGATVIENDLDLRHLIYGRKLVEPKLREHLYLNTYRFPREMTLRSNSLSGVILYRVIHLMPPDEIEEGFAKIKEWLIPGGKLFIAVLPPQHVEYRDKILGIYNQRWDQGKTWPGAGFKSETLLPQQAYALPECLHVMDERPLKKALEKQGFMIEQYGFIDMKKFQQESTNDSHELFGLIAIKK